MIPIDELLTAPTEDEVFTKFMSMLKTMGVPSNSWIVGGAFRSILRIVARFYAASGTLLQQALSSFFLEKASGPWLVLLAKYVYGVIAIPATFATGQVTLVNGGGGMYTHAVGTFQVKNPVTGKTYRNTSLFTLNPGATLAIDIQADEVGSASTAAAGQITVLVTVDAFVTCSNATDVIGVDAESDPALRQRCLDSISAASPNGPKGAYAFAALSASRLDGTPVDINRVTTTPYSLTGQVKVWLASPSGVPTGTDVTAATNAIFAIADPDTVTVTVAAANPVVFTRTLTVWARSSQLASTDDVPTLVQKALAAFIALYPIGGIPKPPSTQGYLYAETIEAVAQQAHPALFDVDIDNSADMPLNAGDVAQLAVTVNLRTVQL
jgi:uncharacterized phage protein gp47/JayE